MGTKYMIFGGKMDCTDHSYAWSGSMPCTGIKKCVFCGDEDPLEIEKREKKQTELKKEKKKSDL